MRAGCLRLDVELLLLYACCRTRKDSKRTTTRCSRRRFRCRSMPPQWRHLRFAVQRRFLRRRARPLPARDPSRPSASDNNYQAFALFNHQLVAAHDQRRISVRLLHKLELVCPDPSRQIVDKYRAPPSSTIPFARVCSTFSVVPAANVIGPLAVDAVSRRMNFTSGPSTCTEFLALFRLFSRRVRDIILPCNET